MLIDWFTVVAEAVNFLLLVWLLKRYLYKPVLATIAERERLIATQLQDAEKKKTEAQQEQANFRNKNEQFEQQRSALLLEATNAANTERQKLLENARRDSEELRAKLQKTVEDEFDGLSRKIGTLAQQEVFSIVRKTLSDLSGVSLEESTANLFIRRLREMSERQKEEIRSALHGSSKPVLVRCAFELAAPQKTAIEDAVHPLLGEGTKIEFETKSDLVAGIELAANGQKISWSITDYLNSLTESVSQLLKPPFIPPTVSPKDVPHAA
jgi:F-type H+-transporting ATPase subunit b